MALEAWREGEKMGGIEVSRECGRKSCPWREVGGHGQGSGGVATCHAGVPSLSTRLLCWIHVFDISLLLGIGV